MNKFLIFGFLLVTSAVSYSSLKNSAIESTMLITATIIKPLTVRSNGDLDFGNILPTVSNHAYSGFTVKGEENTAVKISFGNLISDGASFVVPLYNNNNEDFFDITFNCTTSNSPGKFLNHADNVVALNNSGDIALNIAATAHPKKNQIPGQYKGQITMRATYE